MPDEFVAAGAERLGKARRFGVNVRIDQHGGGRAERIHEVDQPPDADAVAVVAP
jgi:hypothetical protein